jgi:hypothetical protein
MPANRPTFLSLSLTAAALSGCALIHTQTISPGPDTAVLRSGNWGGIYRGGHVSIRKVSGVAPPWTDVRNIAIPPGDDQGEFMVLLCPEDDMQQCRPLANASVAFHADAGRSYVVRARETANGSGKFSVWVEDEQTGAVAGRTDP